MLLQERQKLHINHSFVLGCSVIQLSGCMLGVALPWQTCMELTQPWPWYVAGPLIGLIVPALLLFGGKVFGLSANLRHACAALPLPEGWRPGFFRYDWRSTGRWNLAFAAGIIAGGFVGLRLLSDLSQPLALSPGTFDALAALGVTDVTGFVPGGLISWSGLATPAGALMVLGGGFLIGFGARWAGGCTSGHAISGLADFQLPSLVAVVGFFVGGLAVTHLLLPFLLG